MCRYRVGIFLKTTAALCKQMSITTDLMDFPQKSNRSFFMRELGKGVMTLDIPTPKHSLEVWFTQLE